MSMLPKFFDIFLALGLFLASSLGTVAFFGLVPPPLGQSLEISSDLAFGKNYFVVYQNGACVGELDVSLTKGKGYSLFIEGRVIASNQQALNILGSASFNALGQMTKLEAQVGRPDMLTIIAVNNVYPLEVTISPMGSEDGVLKTNLPFLVVLSDHAGKFSLQTQQLDGSASLLRGAMGMRFERLKHNRLSSTVCPRGELDIASLASAFTTIRELLNESIQQRVQTL